MKQLFYITFFLFLTSSVLAQNNTIKGFVLDNNNNPINYFNVLIKSKKENAFTKGNTFINGFFEFSNLMPNEYVIEISGLGYKTKIITCNLEDSSLDLGKINLETDSLNEIILISKKPIIKRKAGKLIVNVKGSSLADNSSVIGVLKRSPGIIVKNNVIKVFGKGEPLIFINNKIINSLSELDALQPNDIDHIEIDRNPSAKYSASANAILKIYTIKPKKEGYNALIYNNFFVGRKSNNTIGARLNSKLKKFTNYFSYSYKLKNSIESAKSITQSNINEVEQNIIGNSTSNMSSDINNLFLGSDYQINKKSTIGFQYTLSNSNSDDNDFLIDNIVKQSQIEKNILSKTKANTNFTDYNFNYLINIDSVSIFKTNFDISNNSNSSNSDIIEENQTTININPVQTAIKNNSKFNVFAIRLDYEFLLLKDLKTSIGAKYSNVYNNNKTDIDIIDKTQSIIYDNILATYINLEKRINDFDFSLGFRFENTKTETKIIDGATVVIDTLYNNLFPSAMINYKSSDNFNISVSYSKKISRPRFDEISSNIIYIDSLSYSTGNPFIRPTMYNNFELGIGLFKDFSLTFDYSIIKNSREQVAVSDNVNPFI